MLYDKVIFVVDDDISILRSIKRLLNASGFSAEVFDSAESFRDCAARDHGLCVVLDVNLSATCGIELKRQLAASGSALPVIFVTANDSEHTRRTAIDAGCVAFLRKPFPAESLFDAIHLAANEPFHQLEH